MEEEIPRIDGSIRCYRKGNIESRKPHINKSKYDTSAARLKKLKEILEDNTKDRSILLKIWNDEQMIALGFRQ